MTKTGLIMVYTGNGKGKTTAAVGLGLRAVGHGKKVKMIQFMKGPGNVYGETLAVRQMVPSFEIVQCGRDDFVDKQNPEEDDSELAKKGLELARQALSGNYDLVILDEINVVVDFGLLEIDDVIEVVKARAPSVDVVLTGRYAPEQFMEIADLVSEVREVKHHYNKGISAREGIEF